MTFRVLFREINPDPEMNTSTKISTFTLSEGNCELLIVLAPHYLRLKHMFFHSSV